jgi:effector-binding domain-containing protein
MKAENVIGPASIVRKPERHTLGIRLETPFDGMFAKATGALKDLRKWAKANGLADEGPYFLRYYHCDMKATMEIEVGLVTKQRLAGDGHVRPGTLPKGSYASLVYRGNGLRGNQALMAWAKDRGVRFDPIDPAASESYVCRYEAYLTDHRVEPRKLLWDVELSIKVSD